MQTTVPHKASTASIVSLKKQYLYILALAKHIQKQPRNSQSGLLARMRAAWKGVSSRVERESPSGTHRPACEGLQKSGD